MAVQAVPRATATRHRRRFTAAPVIFLAPAIISIIILTLFPVCYSIVVAFTNYSFKTFGGPGNSSLIGSASFVGLGNFIELLSPNGVFAEVFFPVLVWTFAFALITSIVNYVAGLLLAIAMNNPRLPERAIYRTFLIVPWALPATISILIWQGLLNDSNGIVNNALESIGLPGVPWLTDPTGARAAIFLVNLWLGFPFMMIVCLGGLQSIPGDVYEAAAIDGAGALQRLRAITFPLVFRVTLPLLVSTFAYNMMNFGIVYLLTGGNPPRADTQYAGATDVLATLIYKLALQSYLYDKAAAAGIIVFIITAVLSIIGFRISGAFKEVEP